MSDYEGREQTEAKHTLLRLYLQPFAYKILQSQTYISLDYIDGFSGPWKNRDEERFSDTSFGIALETLNEVARSLADRGLIRSIRCIFNEANPSSFVRLAAFLDKVKPDYPLLEIHAIQGTFEENAEKISKLASNEFRLLFIDPTGWTGYSLKYLEKTVLKGRSEILINFMYDHVNRHFHEPSPQRTLWLKDLVGDSKAAELIDAKLSADDVLFLLLDAMRENLSFRFTAYSPVNMSDKRRIHFALLYGTNSPAGITLLRASDRKALSEHELKVEDKKSGGQMSFLGIEDSIGVYSANMREHRRILQAECLKLAQVSGTRGLAFRNFSAKIMCHLFVIETEIKDALVELSKAGKIKNTWSHHGRKKPKDDDLIQMNR